MWKAIVALRELVVLASEGAIQMTEMRAFK